jgi:hypothetical protein
MTETQPFRQFDAGHARHVHVQHGQIRMGIIEQGECGSPISRFEQMKLGCRLRMTAAHNMREARLSSTSRIEAGWDMDGFR